MKTPAVFQGFSFLKDPENILEDLNIALVKAVPFICTCSFNKHSLRTRLVLDIGGWATQLLAGNNTVSVQRHWGQGTKSGLGKADTTQIARYLAGGSPGASEHKREMSNSQRRIYRGRGAEW